MRTSATTWWAPKSGNAASEYEDAYAVKPEALRFAVADGASETSFARQWAELLVEGFVQEAPSAAGLREFVTPLQAVWSERKAADGAFSSLLGLSIDGDRWRAVAVGDTCLFVVRSGKMLRAFPLERAEQFSNRPSLLSSLSRANVGVWDDIATVEGELVEKDRLLLMTDALAHWFLVEAEMGRRPWA